MSDGLDIAKKIIEKATLAGKKIAVAESVTGGMIAAALTAIPGASAVFMCGVVAYSEHAKIHALGVERTEIQETHGYSAQTARQMAEHVLKRNSADIALATTGCAGPESIAGFEGGRVIFALAQKDQETIIFDEHFSGDREEVRRKAVTFGLRKILSSLEN